MKDHLLQTVRAEPVEQRSNLAREYLQLYLLRLMHDAGSTGDLACSGVLEDSKVLRIGVRRLLRHPGRPAACKAPACREHDSRGRIARQTCPVYRANASNLCRVSFGCT